MYAIRSYYDEAKTILTNLITNATASKTKMVSFKLANQSLYNDTYDNLISNGDLALIIQQVNTTATNKITSTSYMTKNTNPGQNVT